MRGLLAFLGLCLIDGGVLFGIFAVTGLVSAAVGASTAEATRWSYVYLVVAVALVVIGSRVWPKPRRVERRGLDEPAPVHEGRYR